MLTFRKRALIVTLLKLHWDDPEEALKVYLECA